MSAANVWKVIPDEAAGKGFSLQYSHPYDVPTGHYSRSRAAQAEADLRNAILTVGCRVGYAHWAMCHVGALRRAMKTMAGTVAEAEPDGKYVHVLIDDAWEYPTGGSYRKDGKRYVRYEVTRLRPLKAG